MKRSWLHVGRRPDMTVHADMTGGTIECVKLESSGVLLRLHLKGVLVEMALPADVAQDHRAEFDAALAWARLPDDERQKRESS